MNYQKIALKKLIIDQDEFLFRHLQETYFTKSSLSLYKAINKWYEKYLKLPELDVFKAELQKRLSKKQYELFEAILNSLPEIKENLTIEELLKNLKEEKVIREIDTIAPDLLEAMENKETDKVLSLTNKIQESILKVDDKIPKSIKEVTFNDEGLAIVDCFLPSLQEQGTKLAGLSIIGGSSGGGKSIFALQQAHYSWQQGLKVSFLSLELPIAQVLLRLYSMVNDYPYKELINMNKEERNELINKWKDTYFDDRFTIASVRYNVDEIKKVVLNEVKIGSKLIVIDYLNLVEMNNSVDEWRNLSGLVKDLHDIAIQNNIVILSPTQINVEENKNKRIIVSTRGSRELEFSASVFLVLFQNSEEYKENIIRLIVQKSRNSRKYIAVLNTKFQNMKLEDTGIILEE